jgi:hypothetical protein
MAILGRNYLRIFIEGHSSRAFARLAIAVPCANLKSGENLR